MLNHKNQLEEFSKLSVEEQQQIKQVLYVYNHVYYEKHNDGSTRISPNVFIASSYEKQIVFSIKFERRAILTKKEIQQANAELAKCEFY